MEPAAEEDTFRRPPIPRLLDYYDADTLRGFLRQIKHDYPDWQLKYNGYEVVFSLRDDVPSNYTRAVQELEILKTAVTTRYGRLRSFVDVWNDPSSGLAEELLAMPDPHEAKWQLAPKYKYKMATTFMPGYAKAMFDYFEPTTVLDPCAGWGDRMLGALLSKTVREYVGFEPNRALLPGYARIQRDLGCAVEYESSTETRYAPAAAAEAEGVASFSSTYTQIHSLPFEMGHAALKQWQQLDVLERRWFDFAFTSPPFFDYEVYTDSNPTYRDWIREFYEPMFKLVEAHLRPGGFFAVHLGDTSAGKIDDFLRFRVPNITRFSWRGKIGLVGCQSGKIRDVYLFQLPPAPAPFAGFGPDRSDDKDNARSI